MKLICFKNFTNNSHFIGPFRIDKFRSENIPHCINFTGYSCKSTLGKYYLWVPPIPGINPNLNYGKPNLAYSEQKITSQRRANSKPPPSATPLTPAIIGFWAL